MLPIPLPTTVLPIPLPTTIPLPTAVPTPLPTTVLPIPLPTTADDVADSTADDRRVGSTETS